MATAMYVGRRPEISVSLPIPGPNLLGEPIRLAPGWGVGTKNDHNESVTLEPFRITPCSMWAALWLTAARHPRGPWVVIRLARGEWTMLRDCLGPFRLRDVLRVTANSGVYEGFRAIEAKPLTVFGAVDYYYTPTRWDADRRGLSRAEVLGTGLLPSRRDAPGPVRKNILTRMVDWL